MVVIISNLFSLPLVLSELYSLIHVWILCIICLCFLNCVVKFMSLTSRLIPVNPSKLPVYSEITKKRGTYFYFQIISKIE